MKTTLKIILSGLGWITIAGVMLFSLALVTEPVGDVVFSISFGNQYWKAGDIKVHIGMHTESMAVYKAKNKPFLLIGPVMFKEDGKDFFFVNKTQVIRSSTEKSGEAWVRIFNLLFIMDDLTDYWRQIRAPLWDDVKSDPEGSISYDRNTQKYCYRFHIYSSKTLVRFEIPAVLFSKDMENAPNITLENFKINKGK